MAGQKSPRRPSSVIVAASYDKRTRTLEIEFTTGRVYRYAGVPEAVYEELLAAPSKGEYFNRVVRNNYGYREMGRK